MGWRRSAANIGQWEEPSVSGCGSKRVEARRASRAPVPLLRSAVTALDEVGVAGAEGASVPVTRRQTTDVLHGWVTERWS